jgi:hypothetical protein
MFTRSKKARSISESNQVPLISPVAPRLLPLTIALSVLLWIVATSGGRQIFVKEVLGDAYDSQAEHLLRGDPGVDVDAIRPEAILINGKARMYFRAVPGSLSHPIEPNLSRWARLLVASLWILRG